MKPARVFIALPIGQDQQQILRRATKKLMELPVRWIRPENFHLTLAFLGNCEPRTLVRIRHHLGDISAAPFGLGFRTIAPFPSAMGPMIAALPETSATLAALRQQVVAHLAMAGIELETRPFRPHVSLGRIARGHVREQTVPTPMSLQWTLAVEHFSLVKSEQTSQGSRYETLAVFDLK